MKKCMELKVEDQEECVEADIDKKMSMTEINGEGML